MSQYVKNIGSSILGAIDSVPSAQPAQVAGYWANIDFWLVQFRHLLAISAGYDHRLDQMKSAHDRYLHQHGGPHNRDEFGQPMQAATSTTSAAERKRIVGAVRTSLTRVADRALDLSIITITKYDDFIERLKAL